MELISNPGTLWRLKNPEKYRAWKERNREKLNAKRREWAAKNREKLRGQARTCYWKNPERSRMYARQHRRIREYGLSAEAFEQLWKSQGEVCASCGQPAKRPSVDHNHQTGGVRGVLCHNCNAALGFLTESVFKAQCLIRYIRRHNQPEAK